MSDWTKLKVIAEMQQSLGALQRVIITRQTSTGFDEAVMDDVVAEVLKAEGDLRREVIQPELDRTNRAE